MQDESYNSIIRPNQDPILQPGGNFVADIISRTAESGLTSTRAGNITVSDTTPVAVANACPACSRPGKLRDHVTRQLVDLPVIGFPIHLHVRIPRFTCTDTTCDRKTFPTSLSWADDGAKLTHRVTR